LIEVKNLSVCYPGQHEPALRDLNLRIAQGEFVLLTGPSGSGKSTLARCLMGLAPHNQPVHITGTIRVDGLDTTAMPVATLAEHIGMVFQNPATQLFNLHVAEEVAFGPRNLGLPEEEITERVAFALEATGLKPLRMARIPSLSGGQQQRVAIASVLAMRPRVLILDEPTSSLDWQGTNQVLETLTCLNREHNLTILLIEHRLHTAAQLAKRALVMHEGQLLLDGPPSEVFSGKAALSGLGLRYPWHLVERGSNFHLPDTISPPRREGVPLVELRDVTAGYARQEVLQDINLSVWPGEFVALVGPNGSGKSTLGRTVAGLLRPRRGQVIWAKEVSRLPLGRRVGVLFQNPLHQLLCDTVEKEVAFGPHNFGLFSPSRMDTVLRATGLTALRTCIPRKLSIGQQQRTVLAAALSLSTSLLVLDEPTIGQDWGHLSRFMDFITHLNENGQAVLLITHDDKLICRYAHRVVMLNEGHIVADGTPCLTERHRLTDHVPALVSS